MKIRRFSTKRDDLIIRGKVYGECAGLKPAVILSHGFMANQSMCKSYAKALSEVGYLCFTFDFCGGCILGSSDGKTYDMSLLTEMKDLEAVVEYVKKLEYVDSNKVSLLGCSQGGTVSALVTKKHPEWVDKLIMFYPALCIPDDARNGKMVFAKFNPGNVPERMWCGPMQLGKCYVNTVKKMDIFAEIGGFNGKVFLVHGTDDRLVNITYSRKAKKLYTDICYFEIEKAGHGFRGKQNKKAIELLLDFMK